MKKILKLENNREYFLLEELIEDNVNYMLIMNIDDDADKKIVKKVTIDGEDYTIDIKDEPLLSDLKLKFKNLVDDDKTKYS